MLRLDSRQIYFSLTALLILVFLSPYQALSAGLGQSYLAFYGGQSNISTGKATATIDTITWFGSSKSTDTRGIDLESSPTFGGRWGFWFPNSPNTGFALDLSFVKGGSETVSVYALPVSFLFFLRLPLLASDAHPQGRFQPYAGLGLSLVSASIDVDFTPVVDESVSGMATGLGPDLRLGLAWEFARKTRFFVEYRYLKAGLKIEDEPGFSIILGSDTLKTADVDFESTQVLIGIAFDL